MRKSLQSRTSLVAAKAAEVVAELEWLELLPDLATMFAWFMDRPGDKDKGCKAKLAAVAALDRLRCDDDALFLRALRHVQREPVWGGSVDTAAELRAAGAAGLVRLNHPEALAFLADLLADSEAAARAGAARALAYRGGDDAAALLRLRLRCGEPEPGVLQEHLLALLHLQPEQGLTLAAELLEHADGAEADPIALALGQSRLPGAFDQLRAWYERSLDAEARRVALTALALLRHDEPLAFLLGLLRHAELDQAVAVAEVLWMYGHDLAMVSRVREAAHARPDDKAAQVLGPFKE